MMTDKLRARVLRLEKREERVRALGRAYQERRRARQRAAKPPDTPEQQAAVARLKETWE